MRDGFALSITKNSVESVRFTALPRSGYCAPWFYMISYAPKYELRMLKRIRRLEIIRSVPGRNGRPTPLLFVHGAFAAAWCWAEFFLPYFAERGYAGYAVSLRGHGGSEGFDELALASLDDYVDDVERAIGEFDSAPVLIGHSMGGMVVQRCLETARVPAAVLMASVPPHGLMGSAFALALKDPVVFSEINLIQHIHPGFATLKSTRRALFSEDLPDHRVARYFGRMQPESLRAIFDMSWPQMRFRHRNPNAAPVLVLGAEGDVFFAPQEVETTARAFGARAEIFPRMAHAMMLEIRWHAVAERIIDWLDEQGL